MIFSKFFKYWLIHFVSVTYLFGMEFTNYIPWETPKHIVVILRIITIIGTLILGFSWLSCLVDDPPTRKDSLATFGNGKLWRVWQWVVLPMFIWGIYKWDHFGIIIITGVFYFGMKCLITAHNKHVDAYRQEEIVRAARQETAEKVTL